VVTGRNPQLGDLGKPNQRGIKNGIRIFYINRWGYLWSDNLGSYPTLPGLEKLKHERYVKEEENDMYTIGNTDLSRKCVKCEGSDLEFRWWVDVNLKPIEECSDGVEREAYCNTCGQINDYWEDVLV